MKKHYSSIISNGFGAFASTAFPKPIQKIINNGYVKVMGLDMSEFQEPKEYKTLNKLFTRKLNRPREINKDEKVVISPVDALVTDFGEIVKGKAYQIKGMEYKIDELFGEYHQESAKFVEGGQFVNLYLSPKDYHRYHMPLKLRIDSMTHIPGKFYPVNSPLLKGKKNLFIENERVIIDCEDMEGDTYIIVLVGALNVGKMIITFEDSIRTNSDLKKPIHYTYDDNLWLEKGELLGWFEMGSTLLLFSEKDTFKPNLTINQKVKFAEPIGEIQ